MNLMNKTIFFKFFGSIALISVMALTTGCGGGGGGGDDTSSTPTPTPTPPAPSDGMKITSFGPSQTAKNITFSAATLDGILTDDLPVTKMASVTLNNKTITITEGQGVRSYEFTLRFDSTDFSDFSFTSGDFLTMSPSSENGSLVTVKWSGSATPNILSAVLTDASGGSIPVMVK